MAFNWKALALELVELAPGIIQAVFADKAAASTETKTQLATQALVQASSVAQTVDPNEAGTIEGVTAVAGGIINAFQAPQPVPDVVVSGKG